MSKVAHFLTPQVLGMIGTGPNIADTGNAALAMPVDECAAEMICAIQARWVETYIPKW